MLSTEACSLHFLFYPLLLSTRSGGHPHSHPLHCTPFSLSPKEILTSPTLVLPRPQGAYQIALTRREPFPSCTWSGPGPFNLIQQMDEGPLCAEPHTVGPGSEIKCLPPMGLPKKQQGPCQGPLGKHKALGSPVRGLGVNLGSFPGGGGNGA